MGAEYIKAVGISVGLWRLADSIWHVGDAVKEGMQGHMSVENTGRQIGQEAFKTFKKLDQQPREVVVGMAFQEVEAMLHCMHGLQKLMGVMGVC